MEPYQPLLSWLSTLSLRCSVSAGYFPPIQRAEVTAGRGKREAGSGKREAGSGKRESLRVFKLCRFTLVVLLLVLTSDFSSSHFDASRFLFPLPPSPFPQKMKCTSTVSRIGVPSACTPGRNRSDRSTSSSRRL